MVSTEQTFGESASMGTANAGDVYWQEPQGFSWEAAVTTTLLLSTGNTPTECFSGTVCLRMEIPQVLFPGWRFLEIKYNSNCSNGRISFTGVHSGPCRHPASHSVTLKVLVKHSVQTFIIPFPLVPQPSTTNLPSLHRHEPAFSPSNPYPPPHPTLPVVPSHHFVQPQFSSGYPATHLTNPLIPPNHHHLAVQTKEKEGTIWYDVVKHTIARMVNCRSNHSPEPK